MANVARVRPGSPGRSPGARNPVAGHRALAWPERTARIIGFALLAVILASLHNDMQVHIFRSTGPSFAVIGLICLAALIHALRGPRINAFWVICIGYSLYGLILIGMSYMKAFQSFTDLPNDDYFILRQSYFVFFLLPLLFGSSYIWKTLIPEFVEYCGKWGNLTLFISICIISILHLINYAPSEPSMRFVYTVIFLFTIAKTKKVLVPISLSSFLFVFCQVFGGHSVFHSSTGVILFGMFSIYAGFFKYPKICIAFLIVYFILILSLLFYGSQNPEVFSFDMNSYWRFLIWGKNLRAFIDSYMFGVGFGAPYAPVSSEMYQWVQRYDTTWKDFLLEQYMIAQHSSLVNVFYRMGIIGGALFILMHIVAIRMLVARVLSDKKLIGRVSLVCLVMVLSAMLQVSIHVGLETPRYLIVYAMTLGLAIACAEMRPKAERAR